MESEQAERHTENSDEKHVARAIARSGRIQTERRKHHAHARFAMHPRHEPLPQRVEECDLLSEASHSAEQGESA